MTRLDARGLACPEPVLRLKKALDAADGEIQLLLDSQVSMENCSRLARSRGYQVKLEGENGQFTLTLSKA